MDKEDTMTEATQTPEGQVAPAPAEGQAQGATPSQPQPPNALSQDNFLETTGFKSFDEAAKSLKEGHATITKLSQEKSQLEGALQSNYQQQQQPPAQGQGGDFYDDPVATVSRIVDQRVAGQMQVIQTQQTIERVRAENPGKFDALKALTQQVFARKPHLNNLGEVGLRQAMEEAAQDKRAYLEGLVDEIDALKQQKQGQGGVSKDEVRKEVINDMNTAQNAAIPQTAAGRAITDNAEKHRQQLVADGNIDALLDLKIPN